MRLVREGSCNSKIHAADYILNCYWFSFTIQNWSLLGVKGLTKWQVLQKGEDRKGFDISVAAVPMCESTLGYFGCLGQKYKTSYIVPSPMSRRGRVELKARLPRPETKMATVASRASRLNGAIWTKSLQEVPRVVMEDVARFISMN